MHYASFIIVLSFSTGFSTTIENNNLSFDKLIIIKSPSEMTINVQYNVSRIGQENLRKFIEETIECPADRGRIVELPYCYRVIALDPYDYICCNNQSEFTGLHLYPFILNSTETYFLMNNLTRPNKRLIFLHVPNENRDFRILDSFEIQLLKRFLEFASQCPKKFTENLNANTKCPKRLTLGPFSACCNEQSKLVNIKLYSLALDNEEELKALTKTLNDEAYFKSLVMD